jgi:O-antigen/teichoic acid export membrane protein
MPVRIISIVISIFVARLLEPSDYAILAIAMMCIGYANLITNFGLSEAIIQQTIRNKDTLNSIFSVDLFLSTLLAFAFYFGADLIADFFHEPRSQLVIRLMSLVFIVTTFSSIPLAILRRDNEFKVFAIYEMVKTLATSGLTLILAILSYGYWALVFGQLIPLVVLTLYIITKVSWRPRLFFNFELIKPAINFGWWSFLKTQSHFLTSQFENIIVGRVLGTHSLGIYDKAKSLAIIPSESFIMHINSVMYSAFTANRDNKTTLHSHFSKSIFLVSVISLPIHLGLVIVSPYFVHLILGEKWIDMIIPLEIILFGFVFKSYNGLLTSFNIAVGKYRTQTILTIVSGVILIMLCLILIQYGIVGISVAFLLYCIVEFTLYLLLSRTTTKFTWFKYLKLAATGLWASLAMFISTVVLKDMFFYNYTIGNMIYIILLGVMIYLTAVLVDNSQHSSDLKMKIYRDINNVIVRK